MPRRVISLGDIGIGIRAVFDVRRFPREFRLPVFSLVFVLSLLMSVIGFLLRLFHGLPVESVNIPIFVEVTRLPPFVGQTSG